MTTDYPKIIELPCGVPAPDNRLSKDNQVAMRACYPTKHNNRFLATTLRLLLLDRRSSNIGRSDGRQGARLTHGL